MIGLSLVNVSHFRFSAPARQLALIKLASISHDQFCFQHVSAPEQGFYIHVWHCKPGKRQINNGCVGCRVEMKNSRFEKMYQ